MKLNRDHILNTDSVSYNGLRKKGFVPIRAVFYFVSEKQTKVISKGKNF